MKRISLEEAKNLQPYTRTPLSGDPEFYTIHLDEEGWEVTTYYTKHNKIISNDEVGSQYVYVLGNDYMPGILKIGYTYNDPGVRAQQLFKTGVPDTFKVLYAGKCFNGMRVERAVHEKLKLKRIRGDREFFKIRFEEAKNIIDEMIEKYG